MGRDMCFFFRWESPAYEVLPPLGLSARLPPPLCISHALVQSDRINLVPNLIWYKCSAATQDMGLVTNLPAT